MTRASALPTAAPARRSRLFGWRAHAGFSYWPTGLLKKVNQPGRQLLSNTHTTLRTASPEIKDGANNKIVYTLDAMGNRTAEEHATNLRAELEAHDHTRVINSLNQLLEGRGMRREPWGSSPRMFRYDDNGNQTTEAAPLSRSNSNAVRRVGSAEADHRSGLRASRSSGMTRMTI